jgi:hypothetical protein
MRSLRPLLIAGLLVATGLLVGCNRQPERMKNQPPDLKAGETEFQLPGMKKPGHGAN